MPHDPSAMLTANGTDVKEAAMLCRAMLAQERLTLRSETIGCLPIINSFLERMGLSDRLGRYPPHEDARLRLAPAEVIGVVVCNIMLRHLPVYALREWVAPAPSGTSPISAGPGPSGPVSLSRPGPRAERVGALPGLREARETFSGEVGPA